MCMNMRINMFLVCLQNRNISVLFVCRFFWCACRSLLCRSVLSPLPQVQRNGSSVCVSVCVCLCVRACVAVCARELAGLIKCVDGSLLRKTGLFTHKRDLFTYQRDEVVSVSLGVVLCGWVRVHVSPKQLHLFCM